MNRICWKLAYSLSRALNLPERDFAMGDLTEARETGPAALAGLFGLVARRQLAAFTHWHAWLLLPPIFALSFALAFVSNDFSSESSVYLWSYANNWDWSLLQSSAFWSVFRDAAAALLFQLAIIVCWSWSAGLLLGAAARRTVPGNAVIFCLLLALSHFVLAPEFLNRMFLQHPPLPSSPYAEDPVSAIVFYREIFPALIPAFFVALPLIQGLRAGAKSVAARPAFRNSLTAAAAITVFGLLAQARGFRGFLRFYAHIQVTGTAMLVLQVMTLWPVAYVLIAAVRRRRQTTATLVSQ